MSARRPNGQFDNVLTPTKKRYILRCGDLRDRLTNKAIARRLGVTPDSVRYHLREMRK